MKLSFFSSSFLKVLLNSICVFFGLLSLSFIIEKVESLLLKIAGGILILSIFLLIFFSSGKLSFKIIPFNFSSVSFWICFWSGLITGFKSISIFSIFLGWIKLLFLSFKLKLKLLLFPNEPTEFLFSALARFLFSKIDKPEISGFFSFFRRHH